MSLPFDANVEKAYNKLSNEDQSMVINLIYRLSNTSVPTKKRNFPFDLYNDGKAYMADDFDETPGDFKDYM